MADLPSVPRRLVLTEAPRSSVSGADIASPYRMIGQAVGEFGAAWETANLPRIEGEGAKSVVRGEDGSVSVAMRPEWSRTDQAFNRGARTAYLAELSGRVRKEFSEIARRHAGDLESLNAALQSSIETHVGGVDPQLVASARDLLTGLAGQTYAGAETQFYNRENQRQLSAINAELERLTDDMAAVARNAGTDTEEYRRMQAQYRDLWGEVVGDPRFSVSEEEAANDIARAEGRHVAEAVIGMASRRGLVRAPQTGGIVDRIIGAESGGDPTATNPNSTATGAGQFIASTWLAMIKRDRPDLAEGKTDEEILALRTDPALSREMTERLVRDNTAALTAAGHGATAGNVYLAHFIGPAGAVGVLEAPAATPVRDALIAGGMSAVQADAAIAANKSVLDGKTAGDVRVWARGKMGDTDDVASLIEEAIWNPDLPLSVEERRRYVGYATSELNRIDAERQRASAVAAEGYERAIVDSASSNGPLISRSVIEDDPTLTERNRNTLLRQYDAAAKDIIEQQQAYDRFLSPDGGGFTPFDADDRKAIDGIYTALGGDGAALKTVVDRTGIVPPSVVKTLRGDFTSTDPARLSPSLQIAANLLAANPAAFAGHDGGAEIEKGAATFRHYVDDLGYSADAAAAKIAEANMPEHQQRVSAKVKGEDVDEIARKNLAVDELRAVFDTSFWPNRIEIGFDPEQRAGMFADYAELFRDRYRETGDLGLAKSLAQDQLKRLWGISTVNGSEVVMRYPPESAPGLAGIPNAGDLVAEEALADIRQSGVRPGVGMDVDRASLRLLPIPGETAAAFKSGAPVPYMLAWEDEDGLVRMLDPGRSFVVDAAAIRAREAARLTAERAEQFRDANAAGNPWARTREHFDPVNQVNREAKGDRQ